MRNAFRVVLFICSALCFLSIARAEGFPKSPLQPTSADCDALFQAITQMAREASNEMSACLRGPAHGGPGFEVSRLGGCSKRAVGIRYWPECFDSEMRSCEGWQAAYEENKICRSRVRSQQAEAEAQLKRAATAYDSLRSAQEKVKGVHDFLVDPGKFFRETLMEQVPSVAASLFKPEGTLNPDRISEASKLYDAMIDPAKRHLISDDPIIGGIQSTALEAMGRVHRGVLNELEVAARQFDSRGGEWVSATVAMHPLPARGGPPVPAQDCSVLDDANASRQLMNADENAWLALVSKCKR